MQVFMVLLGACTLFVWENRGKGHRDRNQRGRIEVVQRLGKKRGVLVENEMK